MRQDDRVPWREARVLEGEEAEMAPGVRIIPTPGHTDGHQSFVVDTPWRVTFAHDLAIWEREA